MFLDTCFMFTHNYNNLALFYQLGYVFNPLVF